MSLVRLYGRQLGFGSHAQVTRGFKAELERHELLAGVVGLDTDPAPGDDPIPGADAPAAIFTGPLGAVDIMRRAAVHEHRFAMVAPNSDRLPPQLVEILRSVCTDILVPSRWAARVAATYFDHPIHVVPHGLHPAMVRHPEVRERTREAFEQGVFVVAHLSTSDRQRKGTMELVRAWEILTQRGAITDRAHLDLVLDLDAKNRMIEWFEERGGVPPNVQLHPRPNLSPENMALALSTAHVVCQPSRGEGFGLVPLEARAVGVPVVATVCTGHSEHLVDGQPGLIVVPHGPAVPIDDLPDASAPQVQPEALAACLLRAYKTWKKLDQDASAASDRVRAEWAWEVQLAPFMNQLKGQLQ